MTEISMELLYIKREYMGPLIGAPTGRTAFRLSKIQGASFRKTIFPFNSGRHAVASDWLGSDCWSRSRSMGVARRGVF